jgi:hypothetical protein
MAAVAIAACVQGCTCQGLKPHAAIALTASKLADETDARPRLWSSSEFGGVVSFRHGDHAWASHVWHAEIEPWWPAGLTAVSWGSTDSGEMYERVYYGGVDGRVHEGGFTPGVAAFEWLGASSYDIRPYRFEALHALAASGGDATGGAVPRYVATTLRNSGPAAALLIWARLPPAFDVEYVDVGSPGRPPKLGTNVFGGMLGAVPCFFAVDFDRRLKMYWRVAGTPGHWEAASGLGQPSSVNLHGDGSAAGWLDAGEPRVSALVRDTDDRLWEARFSQAGQAGSWTQVDDRLSGGTRNGVAAAPRADGLDAAYVRTDSAGRYLQHARHRSGASPEWQRTGANRKPADISIDLAGPLALWPGSAPTADRPRLYMVAEEVNNLGYAFAAVPDDRWHNMLDPAIISREIRVNETAGWTEAAAEEKNGIVLLAAMRFQYAHPEVPSTDPAAEPSVRAVWSDDDGHTWGGGRGFESDYWDGQKYGGRHWLQGDPSAVVLTSDSRRGYVMFHELRFAYGEQTPGNEICAWGSAICASRIRMFRLGIDGSSAEVPAAEGWELQAVQGNPPAEDCGQSPTVSRLWYLDHPVMAAGPRDDRIHVAWLRTDPSDPTKPPPTVFYASLDGKSGQWTTPPVTVAQGFNAPPDIVADPSTPGLSYVLFHTGANTVAICRCAADGAGGSCEPCDQLPSEAYVSGYVQAGSHQIRGPGRCFAASPSTPGKLFLLSQRQIGQHPGPYEYMLELAISNDGGKTWATPNEPIPRDPGDDHFAPKLAVLEDDTVVIHFYRMDSPSQGTNLAPRVGIRDPTGAWRFASNKAPFHVVPELAIDLTRAPSRCEAGSNERFIGDYHLFRGGLTHVHYMAAESLKQAAPGFCRDTCLWVAGASETVF